MTETSQMTQLERVPTVWTDTDEAFFAVVRDLFPPQFLEGAGVLLASHDDETSAVADTDETCGQPHPASHLPLGTMAAEVSRPS